MISYPLRSGKELFDDSGEKQSLDTKIFISLWYFPQPAILIFRNSLEVVLISGEKFNFSQVFSFRGKTSLLLYAVTSLIEDFIASNVN